MLFICNCQGIELIQVGIVLEMKVCVVESFLYSVQEEIQLFVEDIGGLLIIGGMFGVLFIIMGCFIGGFFVEYLCFKLCIFECFDVVV